MSAITKRSQDSDFVVNGKYDVNKIVATLWTVSKQNNKQGVLDIVKIIQTALYEKANLEVFEFYLPQLAHIIIHLESSNLQALEYLAICLCQNSTHTALQLYFIVSASLEDYQLENDKGQRNPGADAHRYFRCGRLLHSILRTVVYGSLAITAADEKRLLSAKGDLKSVYSEQRQERIDALVGDSVDQDLVKIVKNSKKSGPILFKRKFRKSMLISKGWKPRFIRVYDRVLYCYRNDHSELPLRAITLLGSEIYHNQESKHKFVFTVFNQINGVELSFRCDDQSTYDDWFNFLEREIERPPDSIKLSGASEDESVEIFVGQKKRLHQFIGQIQFIQKLTSICEYLRFVDVDSRKQVLRDRMSTLEVPPYCYVPLCSSLAPYHSILKVCHQEAHAFTTKARVPALMLFEVETHPSKLNAAAFLGAVLHEYSDKKLAHVPNRHIAESEHCSSVYFDEETPSSKGDAEAVSLLNIRMCWKDDDENDQSSRIRRAHSEVVPAVTQQSESFHAKGERIRATSPYGHLAGWRLEGLIAKSNDDVRQEVFVMQLIQFYQTIFNEEVPELWLHTYRIVSCSQRTGLIQLIKDAISLDGLKKSEGYPGTLRQHFEATFGGPDSAEFAAAINEFVKSLAAYSLISYLLGIKDRHNGNIMLDSRGHIIHIDFGFVFGIAPGKQFSMERAPFKLTEEFVEVMGGRYTPEFIKFTRLLRKGFVCARQHAKEAITLMEIMLYESTYPCFKYNPNAIRDFKQRLQLHDTIDSEDHWEPFVDRLIDRSHNSVGANLYDQFQLATNGIAI